MLAATIATGVALVFAVERQSARRSEAAAAALNDYLHYAVGTALDGSQWDVLRLLRARVQVAPRGPMFGPWPGDARRVDLARWSITTEAVEECRCLTSVPEDLLFRFDARTGRLESLARTADSAAVRQWVVDTLAPTLRARADSVRWIELFAGARLPARALAMRIVPGPDGPVAYGYVADLHHALQISVVDMFERAALFPRALAGARSTISPVRLIGRTSSGDSLFDVGAAHIAPTGRSPQFVVERPEFGTTVVHVVPGDDALALFTQLAGRDYAPVVPLVVLFALLLVALGVVTLSLRRQAELGRMRWTFAASVSHELRTPLAQILLFAERLQGRRGTPAPNDSSWRQEIDVIVREADRMRYLVENVLHTTQGERAALRLERARVAPIVEDIVDRYEALAIAAGASLVLDVQTDFIAPVDRNALEQVVLNLLDNAVKHGGGAVRVGVGRLATTFAVWVDDAGQGFAEESLGHVWDPFVRGADAVRSHRTGSGLGLSVVRDLVHALGARVEIARSPSGGARVIVSFDQAEECAAAEDEEAASV